MSGSARPSQEPPGRWRNCACEYLEGRRSRSRTCIIGTRRRLTPDMPATPSVQSNLSVRRKSFLQTENGAAVEYVSADSTDCAINWRVRMGGRAGVHIGKWPPAVLAESTEVRQSTRRFVNSIGVASQSFHIPQCVPFVSLDFAKLLGWPRPFRTMMASPLPSWLSITSIPIRRL